MGKLVKTGFRWCGHGAVLVKEEREYWANESITGSRLPFRLPGTDRLMESGTNLGEDYCRFALLIIQRRLAQAGIRVAFTLNEIFK